MSTPRLFRGGQAVDASHASPRRLDILVSAGGKIEKVAPEIAPPVGAEIVDCTGKILLPGLFDMHVHLREPGREDEETIATGGRAAVRGGFTGIVAMPNTDPPIDTGGLVRFVRTLAREQSPIPVWTSGCITKGRAGQQLADIADMHRQGAVMITDDGDPVADAYLFRRALEYARHFDLLTACHCEVPELSRGGAMNEGARSYRLGIPGIPACSEEISIARDLELARLAGARIHIQHVTTARGLDIVRRAKQDGVRVTCEVSPHHLLLNEDDITDYDTNFKMNPPLRTAADNEALLAGLLDGSIDALATDHAPHTEFEKNLDFASAPFGITGLETALPSLYERLVRPGKLPWDILVRAFSETPRRILCIEPPGFREGESADFVVFNPEGRTKVDPETMASKSRNTPFIGQSLSGAVEEVALGASLLLAGKQA
jgi:dihydroorotase